MLGYLNSMLWARACACALVTWADANQFNHQVNCEFFCSVNARCGKRNIFGQEWWTENDYKYQLDAHKLSAQLNQWESHFYLYLLVLQWYTFYFISFSSFEYKHERGIKINENKTNGMKWDGKKKKDNKNEMSSFVFCSFSWLLTILPVALFIHILTIIYIAFICCLCSWPSLLVSCEDLIRL